MSACQPKKLFNGKVTVAVVNSASIINFHANNPGAGFGLSGADE
jgi:hypothetical protein